MRTLLKGFICDEKFSGITRGALLLEDDKIIAVEREITGSACADKVITFKDEIIAPGFIDAHGHSDISALAAADCFSKISQGITAEITGNCGLSPFPVTPANREHLNGLYSNYGIELDWNDHASYSREITRRAPALRLYPLCGHNTLRAAVAGYEPRELSAQELQQMCALLERELRSGASGLSTGLLYVPGCFAHEDELLALMKVLAAQNKVFTTHLRSEGNTLLESLEEILSLAVKAELHKVEISHFKTAGKDNFHKLDAALELMESYRRRGVDVRFDRYPYIESQTMLSVALGEAYSAYGDKELTALLQNQQEYGRALDHLRSLRDDAYWQRVILAGTSHDRYRKYSGEKICDIPGTPAEIVMEILQQSAPDATLAAISMSPENMQTILRHPLCCFGSDGNALPPDLRFGRPHPRSFGGAAKMVRILLENDIPLPEVCWKLSGAAAEFFALDRCGALKCGNYADITVFSPEEIDSRATFRDPALPAKGIVLTVTGGTLNFM